ncbi:hypothetical protein ACWEF6_07070 [Amycolatopsis sp. NPDC004772]
MSSSEPHEGDLHIESRPEGALLNVVDAQFRQVVTGISTLDIRVPVGVYRISARIGINTTSRLVFVEPGDNRKPELLEVGFLPPSPVSGTPDPDMHGEFVNEQSVRLSYSDGPESALMIILRGFDDLTLLEEMGLSLLSRLHEDLTAAFTWVARPSIAVARLRLPTGGYILRSQPRGETPPCDQTVWLCPGWQTLLFIPCIDDRPDVDAMSIHMAKLDETGWEPNAPGNAAAELALADLRTGFATATLAMAEDRYGRYARNPMVRLLAMHALVARGADLAELASEIDTLYKELGEHPDVLALVAALALQIDRPSNVSVLWPPMLTSSYRRCLLPSDRKEDTVLPAGSPAEHVAAYARFREPWLRWQSTEEITDPTKAVSIRPEHWQLGIAPPPAPAIARVRAYLDEVAEFDDTSIAIAASTLGETELSRRLHYPRTLVRAVLQEGSTGTGTAAAAKPIPAHDRAGSRGHPGNW